MSGQRKWQRASLLTVLGYEGAGALVGGSLLVARPDGGYMDIPVSVMRGAFASFLIPGVILFLLGALNVSAVVAVWRRSLTGWIAAGLALGGLGVWFFVEIVILRELHWLHAMWGLPVLWGIGVAIPLIPIDRRTLRDVWLGCGVISSLLYVAMNVVVPMQWPGYDQASRVVSELSAIGAPTRPVWVALGMVYTMLVVAFGWGIRMAAGDDRRLDVVGILISIYGALGFVWPFAPMHLRETLATGGGTFSDTMHIVLGASTEAIYLAALVLAATALGRAFRVYSIATAVALAGFAVLTFRDAPRLGANQLTPVIGVWERINIGLFLLWMVVLAIAMWRRAARTHGAVDRSRVVAPLEDAHAT